MKVLLSSNTPWGTSGYSTQSRLLLKILQYMGHEVAVYAWYGMEGQILHIDGIKVYPRLHHRHGGDAGVVAADWGADIVLTLQDIWVLPETFAEEIHDAGARWAAYFPIDGTPPPPAVMRMARLADWRILYSEYGCREMDEKGLDYLYAPHAVDVNLFAPGDKAAAREHLGIPQDTYLVLMVAANQGFPSRKSYPEAFAAFKKFADNHPEAVLFAHTKEKERPGMGLDLGTLRHQLGIRPEQLRFINQEQYALGLPSSFIAQMYQAADVLLAPSKGEGFGLPIAEAQAAGLPVITQDCTSMSELTVNGIACPPLQPYYTTLQHWQYTADVEAIAGALEQIYRRAPEERAENSRRGVAHFRQNYSLEHVANHYWYPIIRQIEAEIETAVSVSPNGQTETEAVLA